MHGLNSMAPTAECTSSEGRFLLSVALGCGCVSAMSQDANDPESTAARMTSTISSRVGPGAYAGRQPSW